MNCEAFDALCNLEDNGEPFLCMQYKYKTDRYDEVFAVFLAYRLSIEEDLLINNNNLEMRPSFMNEAYNYNKEAVSYTHLTLPTNREV